MTVPTDSAAGGEGTTGGRFPVFHRKTPQVRSGSLPIPGMEILCKSYTRLLARPNSMQKKCPIRPTIAPGQSPLDAFRPRRLVSGCVMVYKAQCYQLINNSRIPSIQHLINECANQRLILFGHFESPMRALK